MHEWLQQFFHHLLFSPQMHFHTSLLGMKYPSLELNYVCFLPASAVTWMEGIQSLDFFDLMHSK